VAYAKRRLQVLAPREAIYVFAEVYPTSVSVHSMSGFSERPAHTNHSVARLSAGIVDRITREKCSLCIIFSILANLIRRSSHDVISDEVLVLDGALPATSNA
jgi:hypothetical protein